MAKGLTNISSAGGGLPNEKLKDVVCLNDVEEYAQSVFLVGSVDTVVSAFSDYSGVTPAKDGSQMTGTNVADVVCISETLTVICIVRNNNAYVTVHNSETLSFTPFISLMAYDTKCAAILRKSDDSFYICTHYLSYDYAALCQYNSNDNTVTYTVYTSPYRENRASNEFVNIIPYNNKKYFITGQLWSGSDYGIIFYDIESFNGDISQSAASFKIYTDSVTGFNQRPQETDANCNMMTCVDKEQNIYIIPNWTAVSSAGSTATLTFTNYVISIIDNTVNILGTYTNTFVVNRSLGNTVSGFVNEFSELSDDDLTICSLGVFTGYSNGDALHFVYKYDRASHALIGLNAYWDGMLYLGGTASSYSAYGGYPSKFIPLGNGRFFKTVRHGMSTDGSGYSRTSYGVRYGELLITENGGASNLITNPVATLASSTVWLLGFAKSYDGKSMFLICSTEYYVNWSSTGAASTPMAIKTLSDDVCAYHVYSLNRNDVEVVKNILKPTGVVGSISMIYSSIYMQLPMKSGTKGERVNTYLL